MSEILILGIYKNKSGYEVIGYIISTRKFCKFRLHDIFYREVRAWDIGAVTKVEGFQKIGDYDIKVIGDSKLDRYFNKEELKEFLNSKKPDFVKFINTSNMIFSVIKPSIIKKIYNKNNRYYIGIISEGRGENLEIKDVRWVTYWNYIVNKGESIFREKEKYYLEFLNSRETYFIGFKETNERYNSNLRYKIKSNYIKIASIFWF